MIARLICITFGMLWLIATGAAAQTKPEAAAKPLPRSSGQATIYFLRLNSLNGAIWGKLSSPGIKVDGRKVGELIAGTYFVVSRPAGHHTLELEGGFLAAPWDSDVVLAAGQTYFITVAPRPTG